jgi:hypothetical protein
MIPTSCESHAFSILGEFEPGHYLPGSFSEIADNAGMPLLDLFILISYQNPLSATSTRIANNRGSRVGPEPRSGRIEPAVSQ